MSNIDCVNFAAPFRMDFAKPVRPCTHEPTANPSHTHQSPRVALSSDVSMGLGAIPIVSIVTKDLTSVNEVSVKTDDGFININKLRLMAGIVGQVCVCARACVGR